MSSSSRGAAAKASGSTGARPKSKKRNTTIEIDVTPSRPSTSTSRSHSPRSPKKKYFADPRRNPSISSAGSPRKRPKKKGKSLGKRLRETVLEEGDDWRQRLRQVEDKNRVLEDKLHAKKQTIQGLKQQHKRDIEENSGKFNTQLENQQEKHSKEKSKLEKEVKSLRKRAEKAELELIKAESIKTSQAPGGAPEAFFQDILVNLKDFLDGQLQCSICNEIYVFPTSINCGHSYCEDCIEGWRKKQANATCPICRADVVMLSPNQVLDGFIEKFIDNFFPEDAKNQRAELVKERKAKKDARAQAAAQNPVLSAGTRRRILNLDSASDDTDDSWDGALAALAVEPGMPISVTFHELSRFCRFLPD